MVCAIELTRVQRAAGLREVTGRCVNAECKIAHPTRRQ